MNSERRAFLKTAGSGAILLAASAIGLLKPLSAWALTWNKAAFSAKTKEKAMSEAGYGGAIESSDIVLTVPDIAEDGSMVKVEALSKIPGTVSMAFFAEKNPNPLVAEYLFSGATLPYMVTHIKMAKTSVFRVAVKADGKVYTAGKEIKVTIGGCGG